MAIFTVIMVTIIGFVTGFSYIFIDEIQQRRHWRRRLYTLKDSLTKNREHSTGRLAERRATLQSSMREFDAKQKRQGRSTRYPPLTELLKQSGAERLTIIRLRLITLLCCSAVFFVLVLTGVPLVFAGSIIIIIFFIGPRWLLSRARGRRLKAFLEEFPNAVDVIVRAVRSGLPLTDGIAMVALDGKEPVASEFKRIMESQYVGLTMPESVRGLVQRVMCPETNFFSIVLQVQSQAGGNISDALANLAHVLRERKRTRAKARAMAAEAKASAWIIGLLPVIVSILVYVTSPDYMMLLFTTHTGNIIVGGSLVWMLIGILIMSKMINFKL